VKLTWNLPNVTSASVAYTTKPIAAGATLAGPIAATVYASSSNTNLELIGSLYDVAPDGAKTLITNGTVLGSLRQLDLSKSTFDRSGKITHPVIAQTHDSYLVPNRVYRFAIALTPTQWAIQPGHKLEFQLTTQAARSCEQDLLGTDPCFFTPQQLKTLPGGVYTIRTGRQTPSALNLPLLPYRFFATAPAPTGLSN